MITDKNIKDLLKNLPREHDYILLSREYIVPLVGLKFMLTTPCNDKFDIEEEFDNEKEARKAFSDIGGSTFIKKGGKLAGSIEDAVLVGPDNEIVDISATEDDYKNKKLYLEDSLGLNWFDESEIEIELNFYERKGKKFYDSMEFDNFDELYEYTEEFYRKHKKHPEPKDPNSETMMDFDITCYTESGKVKLSFEDIEYWEVFDLVWEMQNS